MSDPFVEPTIINFDGGSEVEISYQIVPGDDIFASVDVCVNSKYRGSHTAIHADDPAKLERLSAVLREAANDLRWAQAGSNQPTERPA
jgi:hypothetical protein